MATVQPRANILYNTMSLAPDVSSSRYQTCRVYVLASLFKNGLPLHGKHVNENYLSHYNNCQSRNSVTGASNPQSCSLLYDQYIYIYIFTLSFLLLLGICPDFLRHIEECC